MKKIAKRIEKLIQNRFWNQKIEIFCWKKRIIEKNHDFGRFCERDKIY